VEQTTSRLPSLPGASSSLDFCASFFSDFVFELKWKIIILFNFLLTN